MIRWAKASPTPLQRVRVLSGAALVLALCVPAVAQERHPLDPADAAAAAPRRTHLILKDGSYQLVLRYRVDGAVVHYVSAERNGTEEDVPLALVDLPATEAWARAHDPNQPASAAAAQQRAPVLSPELAREEAARAARMPEVYSNASSVLRLPEDDAVVVLDNYQGTPELVPMRQQESDLNQETAHAVLRKEINPAAAPHDMLFLKEEKADVQLHVADPVFYVRLQGKGDEVDDGGGGLVVDTHGASGRATPDGGSPDSLYVIERVDVRRGERAVSSFLLRYLETGRTQPDVVETTRQTMLGDVWQKLVPKQPLPFGEYVLIEVLNEHTVNANSWDFGVHPTAKENDEAERPEPKKRVQLERR